MLFVIFGTTTKPATTDTGQFFCPQCQSRRSYERKTVKRYGTLYFIPLLPLGEKGEYVECSECQGTFVTRVLEQDPNTASRDFEAQFHKGIRAVMVQMMMADGAIDDSEIETARQIYRRATGTELSESTLRSEAKSLGWRSESKLLESLSSLSGALNAHGKEMIVKVALWIAAADGRFEDEEQSLLFRIGEAMDMSSAHVKGVVAEMIAPDGLPTDRSYRG